jgi:hypothetical protein
MAEPWNTDTLIDFQPLHASSDRINPSDDLVTGDDWHFWAWQLAIHDVQVRAADSASGHLHSNLPRPGLSFGKFCPLKSSSNFL